MSCDFIIKIIPYFGVFGSIFCTIFFVFNSNAFQTLRATSRIFSRFSNLKKVAQIWLCIAFVLFAFVVNSEQVLHLFLTFLLLTLSKQMLAGWLQIYIPYIPCSSHNLKKKTMFFPDRKLFLYGIPQPTLLYWNGFLSWRVLKNSNIGNSVHWSQKLLPILNRLYWREG